MNKSSNLKNVSLTFPVGRLKRILKQNKYAKRISVLSAVFLSTVIEYLVAEVFDLAGCATKDNKKTRITPRHILLAVRSDLDLNDLFKSIIIPYSGVMPCIHTVLLPKKTNYSEISKLDSIHSSL